MTDGAIQPSIEVREYGTSGPLVVLLHGGPGAPGYLAPVARALADAFRVLEPLQRGSGEERLTVARHVADLHRVVESLGAGTRPALVGHSWGAMLALAYGAEHPTSTGAIALIGCGTFDHASREQLRKTRESRADPELRRRLDRLQVDVLDADERLRTSGELTLTLDSYELTSRDVGLEHCDARAHRESWDDMVRLQEAGVYPAAFSAVDSPVLMLHGAVDPHPGPMIRASLAPHLSRLLYRELERCGHYPWLEKHARDDFFAVLQQWLAAEEPVGGPS